MRKLLISLFLLCSIALLGLFGPAYALPISSTGDVEGSVAALDGIANDQNNDLADLNSGPYWYTDWVDLQKFDWPGENSSGGLTTTVDIGLTVTPAGASNTGTYAFNSSVWDTYTDIMIVLKDGGIEYPDLDPPDQGPKYYWFAYLLGDGVYAGDWTYPEGKQISHLSVYGRIGGTPPGETPVPEPGTMMLLGIGLIGMAGVGRKKFKK